MYALQKIEEIGPNSGLHSLSIEAMLENPDAAIRLLTAWKELTGKQTASSPRKPQSRPVAKTHNFVPPDTADQYIAVRDIKLPDALRSSMSARQQAGRKLSQMSRRMGYPIRRSAGAARTYHCKVVDAFQAELWRDRELLREYRMMSF